MASFLDQFTRQPKIFGTLPSQGITYNDEIIRDMNVTSIPIFGMNTMDELILKTPDALFSGEATTLVIKSCIPSILDPWKILTADMDYLLIGVRIATYGDRLPITTTCPKCKEETKSDLHLPSLLDNYTSQEPLEKITYNGLDLDIVPLTYEISTKISKDNYQMQRRLLHIDEQKDLPDEQKDLQKQTIYKSLSMLNFETVLHHVYSISDGENVETDKEEIFAFVKNSEIGLYKLIEDATNIISKKFALPTVDVACASETCNHIYKSETSFDYSNFFEVRS